VLLVRELFAFQREIELFPDDDLLWKTPPGVTNSVGNLATHVCGNLQHFVGRVLGKTGYVRNRDFEFSRQSGSRADLIRELQAAIEVIQNVLPAVDEEVMSRDYPEPVGGHRINTRLFLLHLSAHLAHHLGQAGYLRRTLTANNVSSGPLPLKPLAAAAS
jgi:uncharacterized damage-inducible protein DinB